MNETPRTAQEILGEDFLLSGQGNVAIIKAHERARHVRQGKGAAGIVGVMAIVAACASINSGDSSEALPVLSTPIVTTIVEAPATTSTMVVETTVTREYNCNGDNVVQNDDTVFKIVKFCNAAGGTFTVEGIAAGNDIEDASIIYTGQHITTATTQPAITEAPTTIETSIPVETTTAVEIIPAETAPPETTIPAVPDDGVLSETMCKEFGGIQHEVPAGYGWYKFAKLVYMKTDGSKAVEDADIAQMLNDPEFQALREQNKVVYLMGTEPNGTKHLECFPTQAQKDEALNTSQ